MAFMKRIKSTDTGKRLGSLCFAMFLLAGTCFGQATRLSSLPVASQSEWTEVAKLSASDGSSLGAVAISGNTVVASSGQAGYVFVETINGWQDQTENAKLTTSDGAGLGPIAISGDTVVAGSQDADDGSGAAYVFVEPASGWTSMTETAKLTSGDASCYYFGMAAAINGNTVVVGCPPADGDQGAGYVFVKPASGWTDMTATAKLTTSDKQSSNLGLSTAISGNTVVLGAPFENVGSKEWQGAAYLYVKPVSGWADMTETARLTASDGKKDECFGWSLAIFGNTAVAGGLVYDSECTSGPEAYVFVKPGSGWKNKTETARLTVRRARLSSVAMSSHMVVASDLAAAYVFQKPDIGWRTTSKFNARINASGPVAVKGSPPTVVTAGGAAAYIFLKVK